jgi:hypothetical protein
VAVEVAKLIVLLSGSGRECLEGPGNTEITAYSGAGYPDTFAGSESDSGPTYGA